MRRLFSIRRSDRRAIVVLLPVSEEGSATVPQASGTSAAAHHTAYAIRTILLARANAVTKRGLRASKAATRAWTTSGFGHCSAACALMISSRRSWPLCPAC